MAKKIKKDIKKHLFLGGNYAMGNTMFLGLGVFVFERLKKCQKIGSNVKKANRTYEQNRLIFVNPETVSIMIKHLEIIRENMLEEKANSKVITEFRIDLAKYLGDSVSDET